MTSLQPAVAVHSARKEGAWVVELASMLAGERSAVSGLHARWIGFWGSPRALGVLCAKASLQPRNHPSLGFRLARALVDIGSPEARQLEVLPPIEAEPVEVA